MLPQRCNYGVISSGTDCTSPAENVTCIKQCYWKTVLFQVTFLRLRQKVFYNGSFYCNFFFISPISSQQLHTVLLISKLPWTQLFLSFIFTSYLILHFCFPQPLPTFIIFCLKIFGVIQFGEVLLPPSSHMFWVLTWFSTSKFAWK